MSYYTFTTATANSTSYMGTLVQIRIAPPAPPPIPQIYLDAAALLGVTLPTSWEAVEKAYRPLAKLHHPDAGGDAETMKAINNAYNLLKEARPK